MIHFILQTSYTDKWTKSSIETAILCCCFHGFDFLCAAATCWAWAAAVISLWNRPFKGVMEVCLYVRSESQKILKYKNISEINLVEWGSCIYSNTSLMNIFLTERWELGLLESKRKEKVFGPCQMLCTWQGLFMALWSMTHIKAQLVQCY